MSAVVADLLDNQVLTEAGIGQSAGGRRPRLVSLNPGLGFVAGVDIGATSVDTALADYRGDLVGRTSEDSDVTDGPERVLNRAAGSVERLLQQFGAAAASLHAIGIGVPAPVDHETGLVSAPPMSDWDSYPIHRHLQAAFSNAEITVDNDANIMALGEYKARPDPVEHLIFLKIGTGIGSGILLGGKIYRGNRGFAGEFGHICVDRDGPICRRCGNVGCLEAVSAGPAIARQAHEAVEQGRSPILLERLKSHGPPLSPEDVGAAAAAGDRASIQIIKQAGWWIGESLAAYVNLFNPELILIGGGVSNIGAQFLTSIRQAVLRRAHPKSTEDLRIEYGKLGAEAGIRGAISLALGRVLILEGAAAS